MKSLPLFSPLKTFCFIFLMMNFYVGYTQTKTDSVTHIIRCASAQYLKELQAKGLAESDDKFEGWMKKKIIEGKEFHKTHRTLGIASGPIYKIPIIFHIVYSSGEAEGTGNNISYDQVLSQLNRLNLDYQKLNDDASTVPSWFAPAAADIQFEFVLAKVNPKTGVLLDEPGVDRYLGTRTSYTTNQMSTVKTATIFCPDSYFNVWVANLNDGTLGIATFAASSTLCGMPGNPCGNDGGSAEACLNSGVIINNIGFGDHVGTAEAPYDYGRTLTHESGHYFGLRHTWGDDACANDFCDDIPLEKDNYFGAPASANTKITSSTYSCSASNGASTIPDNSDRSNAGSNGIMYQDYMDYTDDAAMKMFTTDQKNRMHTTMWKSPKRNTLATSQVYLAPATTAAIGNDRDTICVGSSIMFSDITDYTNKMAPTKWSWSFQNTAGGGCTAPATVKVNNFSTPIAMLDGLPTTGNNITGSTLVTFPSPGTYQVTLYDTAFLNTDAAATASSCTLCKTNWVNTATKTIVVLPPPSVTINPSGTVVCNTSISLTAGGNANTSCGVTGSNSFSYAWSPATDLSCSTCANPTASPSSATTYTVVAADAKGCSASTTVTVNSCTPPQPTSYIFSGNGNWSDAANWDNNIVPPPNLISGSQIIIDPEVTGACYLDVAYTVSPGVSLTVMSGKKFIVPTDFLINQH